MILTRVTGESIQNLHMLSSNCYMFVHRWQANIQTANTIRNMSFQTVVVLTHKVSILHIKLEAFHKLNIEKTLSYNTSSNDIHLTSIGIVHVQSVCAIAGSPCITGVGRASPSSRIRSACACIYRRLLRKGGIGPRAYPCVVFKPRPSPFIAEFAHTQLHSARAHEITDRINGEGLGSDARVNLSLASHRSIFLV